MSNIAIVSAHIFIDENERKDIEILTQVDNDYEYTGIFEDIDHAMLDQIDIGEEDDYYFMALIESRWDEWTSWEGTEYDVEHHVSEIKKTEDILHYTIK